jgi:uncharacterized protein with von Willebrand factor type A (vWA) domain
MPLAKLTTLAGLLGRGGSKIGVPQRKPLPDWTVTHTSLDKMQYENAVDGSPKFRRVAVEDAPPVPVKVEEPGEIDFTTATPEEIKDWQAKARAAKQAKEAAPTYEKWSALTRDIFAAYHTDDIPEVADGPVDPSVELHRRIVPKMLTTDDFAASRNVTRGDPVLSSIATMAASQALKEALGEELEQQLGESQDYQDAANQAGELVSQLQDLRDQAREQHQQGTGVSEDLRQQIKDLVQQKQAAQAQALAAAESLSPMTAAAMRAIEQATASANEAAQTASKLPSFGQGLGEGEPRYESPEQALSIAEMWANDPKLRAMADLFGRMDRHIRFERSKRVVGGQDEIVDVEFGDNLKRVLPSELALLADEDFEDDFLARYASRELLCFSTVGEEHVGRGPIIVVCDGSGSMGGANNIWARAVGMCLLHIARLEKRDFAFIEFSSGSQVATWLFEAKKDMMAQDVLDMCAHFFGGGTTPVIGVAAAAKVMDDAAPFRKADIVMIGDGVAGFTTEDSRLHEYLTAKGVRFFGLAIGGGRYDYLLRYCEKVVDVHSFELNDPSAATAELATFVS